MASRKKTSTRGKKSVATKNLTSPADDWITIRYGTLIYYILIGLIIGLAIGALLLMWVAQSQSTYDVISAPLQSQSFSNTL